MTRAPSMWHPSDPVPPTASASFDSDDASSASVASVASDAATAVVGAAGQAQPASLASHPGSDSEDWGAADGGYAPQQQRWPCSYGTVIGSEPGGRASRCSTILTLALASIYPTPPVPAGMRLPRRAGPSCVTTVT